jgi:GNAT superfamily N-acetyltransferase
LVSSTRGDWCLRRGINFRGAAPGIISMRLLEKWFNIESYPNTPFVIDRKGRKFWLDWEDYKNASFLRVYHYGKPVGRINVVWEDDCAVLADIVLHNPKHRGYGVGKAILRELIFKARSQGVHMIVGQIVVTEEEEYRGVTKAFLREWYQRQGFEVSSTGSLRLIL